MLLQPARLTRDANGQPRSDPDQDSDYNPGAGFAESEHVFINGNRLHERIARARHLTIGEIGYGTGLNFIHTADTFLREAPPEARLHYISFELHPIAADTLAKLQRDWPRPDIRAAVLAQNPHNHPGHHLIKAHPRIHLHLIQGDIRATPPPAPFPSPCPTSTRTATPPRTVPTKSPPGTTPCAPCTNTRAPSTTPAASTATPPTTANAAANKPSSTPPS